MKIDEKLGTFTKIAQAVSFKDVAGNPMDHIEAGKTVVHGPWRLVTKAQIARVIGPCTESICNTVDKDGKPVFKFQGDGWEPEASPGDLILVDHKKPSNVWACKPGLFGGTGWTAFFGENRELLYSKPGKPLLALEVPPGTVVKTLEGEQTVGSGGLLTLTDANVGDFYSWQRELVEANVREYKP
jgi:hypothetical protein